MITISCKDDGFTVQGTFDMGYMGLYSDGQIQILDKNEEVRQWDIVTAALDAQHCTDAELSAFLTDYYNALEQKISQNRKFVNDNFLVRIYTDMEACGLEFWEYDELTIRSALPEDPDEMVYPPKWDVMRPIEEEYEASPNDGTVQKTDAEAVLREHFPMFHWDALLDSIEPEYLTFEDRNVSFQCSDGFGNVILCGAYDRLDEQLMFRDWHNF